MAISSQPANPHNNVSPNMLDDSNYKDPFTLATLVAAQQGLPTEVLDQIHTDCASLVKDSWLGFLDMFQMNIAFETDYAQFVESTSPDYVIDDDGAVTRAGEVFTIDWTAVEGWEVGEDPYFFRIDDVVAIYDATKKEMGVITAINSGAGTFTAKCRNGAAWTVATTNLTIDVNGGDFDKGSCGPEGLLELRKTQSKTLKFQTIKDAMQSSGGNRYAFFIQGEVSWYDDNTLELTRRLNTKIAKTLMNDIESASGSGAHGVAKFGTQGLFDNLESNGLVHTGYITDLAGMQTITTYWDTLGYANKEFVAHVDPTQVRHFEAIASEIATSLSINLDLVLGNTPDNFMRFGFSSILVDGYTIHFSKWTLTTGNSPLGKQRIQALMPKGVIMPMGTVPTKINGVEKRVPYIFKAYQDKVKMGKGGMVRTYLTGGFAGGNGSDCEYLKISKSTTVGLAVVCPEAITLIK
jgi:hypothetical protein